MTKDKPVEEETEETPEYQSLPNINDILKTVKECLPSHVNITPNQKDTSLCEVHIIGTEDLIKKILKV